MPKQDSSSTASSASGLETGHLLALCRSGDEAALDEMFSRVYREMRGLARSVRRGQRDTMGTTGLIHEAYLKLRGAERLTATDRKHFCRTAAKAMRQILINAAEARMAQKRGAGRPHQTLIDDLVGGPQDQQLILDVATALTSLRDLDQRMAEIVDLRYFGGYTSVECADLMDVSVATVQREWRLARAWLNKSLDAERGG